MKPFIASFVVVIYHIGLQLVFQVLVYLVLGKFRSNCDQTATKLRRSLGALYDQEKSFFAGIDL